MLTDDQVDGIEVALARELHQFAEMTDEELEQLGKDEGSMPSIPNRENISDDVYSKELDDYAGFEPENELNDARKEMQFNTQDDLGDYEIEDQIVKDERDERIYDTPTGQKKGYDWQIGGEQEDEYPDVDPVEAQKEQDMYNDMEPEMDINWGGDPQEQEELDEGGIGSGPQGGGGDDFYEAGMMQPSSTGTNTMYRDMSDVKSSGQDIYLDMAQKDYDDPNYELSNQDYEDVYDQGKIREGGPGSGPRKGSGSQQDTSGGLPYGNKPTGQQVQQAVSEWQKRADKVLKNPSEQKQYDKDYDAFMNSISDKNMSGPYSKIWDQVQNTQSDMSKQQRKKNASPLPKVTNPKNPEEFVIQQYQGDPQDFGADGETNDYMIDEMMKNYGVTAKQAQKQFVKALNKIDKSEGEMSSHDYSDYF